MLISGLCKDERPEASLRTLAAASNLQPQQPSAASRNPFGAAPVADRRIARAEMLT